MSFGTQFKVPAVSGDESDNQEGSPGLRVRRFTAALLLALAAALALPLASSADDVDESKKFMLDFRNAELTAVIDLIAKHTGKNFIYDDRVRGRVTIISPEPMTPEQAWAVFESVLLVKGFTTVETPSGALKVIPLRDAKETNVETSFSARLPANRDTFITRLIPLAYIDAESIVNTLKPLVSKDAAMTAYAPTNMVILTESSSNIRRLIKILESLDIETYREELAVLKIEYADAATLADQISQIFGERIAPTSSTQTRRSTPSRRAGRTSPSAAAPVPAGLRGTVRIITDERTNSLIVLAPKTQLEEVRRLVRKLDIEVSGGGRIHVYYLQHADAEELAQTLSAMISGRPATPAGGAAAGGGASALRTAVAGLSQGLSVTADPATNALLIQASKEGYNALSAVIAKLDIPRPQVLIEALFMEVDVTDSESLGFSGLVRIVSGDTEFAFALGADAAAAALLGPAAPGIDLLPIPISSIIPGVPFLGGFGRETDDSTIKAIIRAAAGNANTNIISAPHILTSDNEEAEIRIGDNIPIVTSRIDAATGGTGLSTSVNIERLDIGVTLRVTPQITEGNMIRLDIFQEITAINLALSLITNASAQDTGVALSNRRVENTVVVGDGDTVVIGGLISDQYDDTIDKVPFLGDIPILGWMFKSTSRTLTKKNLLIFLTPHIVRSQQDLIAETIRKREEFIERSQQGLKMSDRERAADEKLRKQAEAAGKPYTPGRGLNPVRHAMFEHAARYPLERMFEIEKLRAEERARAAARSKQPGPQYLLRTVEFADEQQAIDAITTLVDLGYDGTLVTAERNGRLFYEIRVGPYDSLQDAQQAARVLERAQGISSTIEVQTPEENPEP